MEANTVRIDRATTPATIAYAPSFNVAVPFIDRHLHEGRGARVAIRTRAGDTTYAALAEAVNRAGNALLAAGLARGARVMMVVKDCPEFVALFFGAIKAGLVPVPVNTLLRAPDYCFMLEESAAAALAYSPEYAAEVEAALAAAHHRPALLAVVGAARQSAPALQDLMAKAAPSLAPAPATAADDCFWLFSSGSTGSPKAAVHRHRDMVETSEHYGVGILGVSERDVAFSAAKLFFAYGLGNAMTFPLWVGGQAVLFDGRPTPEATFDVIAAFRPTLYFGVPTLYAAQLRALAAAPRDLSCLRACVSAGEALPAEICRRWRERTGVAILDGIGSTEALHIFISNRLDDVRPGSSGRVVPGYAARILGEDGAEVARGASGRLWITGESTAARYWHNPEKTAATMRGGWLDTGDTYRKDADGYYVYCGRSDDMLKIGGIWCSPFEIEARLIEHPKVLEAAVVGRQDADGLTKPAAYVILNQAGDAGETLSEDLRAHCKAGLAAYKYPRWITYVTELPKTATGKIQRFKLRAAAGPAGA
ncbi:MAG: benzoate-CoA ligase family protein [Alphaproteobacteria bacterium]|nr:benzoate-CoA ligase family protein [Alphaproteobacteria bacterium]